MPDSLVHLPLLISGPTVVGSLRAGALIGLTVVRLLHSDHVRHELIDGDLGALIEARRFVVLEVRFIPV